MSAPPAELFRRLTNGVYVVTAAHEGRSSGFTAAWITEVSFDPMLLALSVNPGNFTWSLLQPSGRFIVNVLSSGQDEFVRQFGTRSGRDLDKFAGIASEMGPGGVPRLAAAVAWLDCRVEQQLVAGDHVVVVARVVGGGLTNRQAVPMRYDETGQSDGSAGLYPPAFPGS